MVGQKLKAVSSDKTGKFFKGTRKRLVLSNSVSQHQKQKKVNIDGIYQRWRGRGGEGR